MDMDGASSRRRAAGLCTVLLLAAGLGCRPADSTKEARQEGSKVMDAQQLAEDLGVVRRARIYFYHHSVGENLLAGVKAFDGAVAGTPLAMVAPEQAATRDGPVLAHAGGGRNGDPKGKIDFFAATVRQRTGLKPDLTLMKLCYADFNPRTDVEDVFAHYQRTLEALQREHPEIRFAHVTVPLMASPTGLKASVYRLIGREVWADASNVRRAEFNRRLKESFPSDAVLDLAHLEATTGDGGAVTFEYGGRRYPALNPEYTDDGGHLNPAGQQVAGAAVIRFLASVLHAPAGRNAER